MRYPRRSVSRDRAVANRIHERAVIASDGFRYPLTDRSFRSPLLALQRRIPHTPEGGSVASDLGRRPLHWGRNKLSSVGKLCAAAGIAQEAERLLVDALVPFERLRRTDRAVEVPEKLYRLRSPPTLLNLDCVGGA